MTTHRVGKGTLLGPFLLIGSEQRQVTKCFQFVSIGRTLHITDLDRKDTQKYDTVLSTKGHKHTKRVIRQGTPLFGVGLLVYPGMFKTKTSDCKCFIHIASHTLSNCKFPSKNFCSSSDLMCFLYNLTHTFIS